MFGVKSMFGIKSMFGVKYLFGVLISMFGVISMQIIHTGDMMANKLPLCNLQQMKKTRIMKNNYNNNNNGLNEIFLVFIFILLRS